MNLTGRNYLKEADFTKKEFLYLVDLAASLRQAKRTRCEQHALDGRNIALIFEKTSTRTRSAFDVAAHDQGAHVSYLGPGETQLGKKESVKDTARVLGRMYDGIEFRGFAHEDIEELAEFAGVPVWNGLTEKWHPTQSLCDVRTMLDHCDKPIEEITLCYIGDARNNMANSLFVTGALLGMDVRLCAPRSLWPDHGVGGLARDLAEYSGARITETYDIEEGARDADFIYTDVWVSMGEPTGEWSDRIEELRDFAVTSRVMNLTHNPDTKFMHCLPALHNRQTELGEQIYEKFGLSSLEVTDEVFESPASIVFDQAENRLHTIKSVMVATLGQLDEEVQP